MEVLTLTTVAGQGSAEIIEKKSRFISHAAPVSDTDAADVFISDIRARYPDASHTVYAYHIKNGVYARYSDDGEPQGSSGPPVLEYIRKSGVTDVVVTVTRYFGGTLLGVGGLSRAYTAAAAAAVESAGIVTLVPFAVFAVDCSYSEYGRIEYELGRIGGLLEHTLFGERVTFHAAMPDAMSRRFADTVAAICSGRSCVTRIGTRMQLPK